MIKQSLESYSVPASAINRIANIYSDYRVTVAVNTERAKPLAVDRGVIQGDPCSPLLFNIAFNSLMKIIFQQNYNQLGYLWGPCNNIRGGAWLQFADDTIIVTSSDKITQSLVNVLTAWCIWAGMKIRIKKCQAFGMRKQNDQYSQYTPAISSSNTVIPAVSVSGSFTYLGKLLNSDMKNEEAKVLLKSKLDNLLVKVSSFAVKPQTKIKMLKMVIYPRISFELKSYNFSSTWIAGVLDGMVHTHIRRWLELPVSSCIE